MYDVDGIEGALPRLLRIADEPRGTAHQRQRSVPRLLEPADRQDLEQVAHVEARRCRIESAVERDRTFGRCRRQPTEISRVGNEPTPGQVVEDPDPRPSCGVELGHVKGGRGGDGMLARAGHDVILPHRRPDRHSGCAGQTGLGLPGRSEAHPTASSTIADTSANCSRTRTGAVPP